LPAPIQTAFADTDFEIPAAYTKGKKQISITVEHVNAIKVVPAPANDPAKAAAPPQADGCNEYYYWVYCYGPTPLKAQE
jgi:hypothetical protein